MHAIDKMARGATSVAGTTDLLGEVLRMRNRARSSPTAPSISLVLSHTGAT